MPAFWEIMEKLGRGQKLNPFEQSELRDQARAIDEARNLVKGWVQIGSKTPIFVPSMEAIYSEVLRVDTASLTINIPNTYKHLLIFGAGRTTGAGTTSQFMLGQFNGDTGANYSQQWLRAFSTTVEAFSFSAQSGALLGSVAEGGTSAGIAGAFVSIIPHYLDSYHKNAILLTGRVGLINFDASIWANTNPISSIKFYPASDSFAAGFLLSVYGLR
jgi:hypothetical protein